MTATSASVRFGTGGTAEVQSAVHLAGSSRISCYIYDDIAPILAIDDAHVKVSVTVPDRDQVTAEDLTRGRLLAEAVSRYVAELERRAGMSRQDTPGREDCSWRAA
jgi:hypothetical protein